MRYKESVNLAKVISVISATAPNKTASIYKSFNFFISFIILALKKIRNTDDKKKPMNAKFNNNKSSLLRFKNSQEPLPKNMAENSAKTDFKKPIRSLISSICAKIIPLNSNINTKIKNCKG